MYIVLLDSRDQTLSAKRHVLLKKESFWRNGASPAGNMTPSPDC